MAVYNLEWAFNVYSEFLKHRPRAKILNDLLIKIAASRSILISSEDICRLLVHCLRIDHGQSVWKEYKAMVKAVMVPEAQLERFLTALMTVGKFCKEELDQLQMKYD